ncbi:MAG: excinuclease ABC subunit UvrA [bacterium]|nr:excinuclease ABC subunit UvrA [bacterium]
MKPLIKVHGARVNNLRNLDVEIPRYRLTVLTGPSGSGKSSLAFDTLFAEGQRRYVESLSTQARSLIGELVRPDVDLIEGLSPAVAVNQHSTSAGPRSTVGTLSEIGNYLRLLYARVGELSGGSGAFLLDEIAILERLTSIETGRKVTLLAPVLDERKGAQKRLLDKLRRAGLVKVRLNGEICDLDDDLMLIPGRRNSIEAVVDRLKAGGKAVRRLEQGLRSCLNLGAGRVRVLLGATPDCDEEEWNFTVAGKGETRLPEMSPSLFSFNSRSGACGGCQGMGRIRSLREDLLVPDTSLSLGAGAVDYLRGTRGAWLRAQVEALAEALDFTLDTPYREITAESRKTLLYGSKRGQLDIQFKTQRGRYRRLFEGLIPYLERRQEETSSTAVRKQIEKYMGDEPCPDCGGRRLSSEALRISIGGLDYAEITALPLKELDDFIRGVSFSGTRQPVAEEILPEILSRVGFLMRVGLGYLSLDRATSTLSGGERQRLALAEQVGASMTGVLYILDEPSIGLHPRDHQALLETLVQLRDRGNTVIVVEHDRETIERADWIIDLGPAAGENGGQVIAVGTPETIRMNPASLTGRCLLEAVTKAPRKPRKKTGKGIQVLGARQHNLKKLDVEFPLGLLTCVTGVSGSGKSTLVHDILYAVLAREKHRYQGRAGLCDAVKGSDRITDIVHVDQTPIGRSPRSNPATFAGLWGPIRDLYSSLPESRIRGYGAGRFSFNVKGGRCEECQGGGQKKVTLHFLPTAYVTCEACRGRRFNRETLDIHYRGRNIAEVLEMTIEQALEHFSEIPKICRGLQSLSEVGLGYLRLGQSALTLSGGEAQRLKLARELSRRSRGHTFYILDEPSTGLHFDDVKTLMAILHRLVDKGHSVTIIEHNPDIIREADWIIDLGPEGGPEGGELLFSGRPADIVTCARSHTGAILRR